MPQPDGEGVGGTGPLGGHGHHAPAPPGDVPRQRVGGRQPAAELAVTLPHRNSVPPGRQVSSQALLRHSGVGTSLCGHGRRPPLIDPSDVLRAPLPELMAEAARIRDAAHGDRVTFSPKVFIPLTMLCRDRCGYCTFAKPPARLDSPYLELDEVAGHRPGRPGGRLLGGAVHPRRAARGALPRRPRVAGRPWLRARRSTTWWPPPGRCWPRRACCPTPTPGRSPGPNSSACGPCRRRRA